MQCELKKGLELFFFIIPKMKSTILHFLNNLLLILTLSIIIFNLVTYVSPQQLEDVEKRNERYRT